MPIDRNPSVAIPKYATNPEKGAGEYSLNELIALASLRVAAAKEAQLVLDKVITFFDTSSVPPDTDTAAEIAAFDAGMNIAAKRLLKSYKTAMNANQPTVLDVRNAKLRSLIAGMTARYGAGNGTISEIESGLHNKLFVALDVDGDGQISQADIAAGISA